MRYHSLPDWGKVAITHKIHWMNSGKERDSPPAIFVEWDEHPIALVVCLGDDEIVGKAIVFLRAGMDPDAVVTIHDTFLAVRDNDAFGAETEAALKSGRVTLAQMAREGGLERGTVVEAMAAIRQGRDGKQEFVSIPYKIHGKTFGILDGQIEHMANPEGIKPELLAECIRMGAGSSPDALDTVAGLLGLPRKKARIHGARATLQLLQRDGYMVLPFHPGLGDLADYKPDKKRRRPDPDTFKRRAR